MAQNHSKWSNKGDFSIYCLGSSKGLLLRLVFGEGLWDFQGLQGGGFDTAREPRMQLKS